MEKSRCTFWLPKKKRFCANVCLNHSLYCGNHNSRSDGDWITCPIDPSHSVLQENLQGHLKRCPLLKQLQSLTIQPFYQKGVNAGNEDERGGQEDTRNSTSPSGLLHNVSSEMKRNEVYSMSVPDFCTLIRKIESIHDSVCKDIRDSYKIPEACDIWIKGQIDRRLPFQEKHVIQQASILGNLEDFGVLKNSVSSEGDYKYGVHALVEFGAGRGYLTQMLADCYGIRRVFLVERKSYKLKADRSLRQKERLILERLRIDIEDLNLKAVESLRGFPYLAIGKHICGSATDLTLRCCLEEEWDQNDDKQSSDNRYLRGLAIATCCHHLCQWKHYINKKYLSNLGITQEEFHAITWFTSWAVDADHGSDLSDGFDSKLKIQATEKEGGGDARGVEDMVRKMKVAERAVLGFRCKQIIDMGRLIWIKECGLDAQLVKYVPSNISPENHLLIARRVNDL